MDYIIVVLLLGAIGFFIWKARNFSAGADSLVKELSKQRETTETCCAILKQSQGRNQILDGFKKVARLLKAANDPLAASAEKINNEGDTLPDEYLAQLRDDFIGQCNAFLSATRQDANEPIQETKISKRIESLDDIKLGSYSGHTASSLLEQIAQSQFIRVENEKVYLTRLARENHNLYLEITDQDYIFRLVHIYTNGKAGGKDMEVLLQ